MNEAFSKKDYNKLKILIKKCQQAFFLTTCSSFYRIGPHANGIVREYTVILFEDILCLSKKKKQATGNHKATTC